MKNIKIEKKMIREAAARRGDLLGLYYGTHAWRSLSGSEELLHVPVYEVVYLEKDNYDGEDCYNCVNSEYFDNESDATAAFEYRLAHVPSARSEDWPKKPVIDIISEFEAKLAP